MLTYGGANLEKDLSCIVCFEEMNVGGDVAMYVQLVVDYILIKAYVLDEMEN